MPALVFLVLVGLFAHSVFVPAGPVSKLEAPLPKVVVINTAGQVIDTWQQNTKGEIIVEVPVVEEEEIAEAEPVEVPEEEAGDETTGDEGVAEESENEQGANDEESDEPVDDVIDEESAEEEVSDPVEEEEVIEETFEAPPVVEDPILVIEEQENENTENNDVPQEINLVEALIGE